MARTARKKSESGIYHVMLRGIDRREIFLDDEDCQRFLDALSDTSRGHRGQFLCPRLARTEVTVPVSSEVWSDRRDGSCVLADTSNRPSVLLRPYALGFCYSTQRPNPVPTLPPAATKTALSVPWYALILAHIPRAISSFGAAIQLSASIRHIRTGQARE